MGKARIFSDESRDAVYQKEADNEVYSTAAQQNSYNLGSTHFSDQSGIGNFSQAGTDQRKASVKGALFQGNIGFDLQTAVLDVPSNTIDLLEDGSSVALPLVSSDRIVSLSAGSTADLITITGAQRPGQRLFLYGIFGNTITIKHTAAATANTILTPDELDYDFSDNMIVMIVYDISTAKWRIAGTAPAQGSIIPSGTAENQHLEWDNTGMIWEAKDVLEFAATGPHADAGLLRFPNDVIWAAGRTGADDGNVELKWTTNDELDFTVSNNSNVTLLMRAQHAIDPDNLYLITNQSGSAGDVVHTFPNELSMISGVQAVFLLSATKALYALPISMDTNEVFLDNDENSGIFSSVDDIVQIFTGNIIRAAFTNVDFQLGVDADLLGNDLLNIGDVLWDVSNATLTDSATGLDLVLVTGDALSVVAGIQSVLDVDETGVHLTDQNLTLGNNDITGINQIAFNEVNQTITDDVNGMRFSLPDAADTFDFTINSNLLLSMEKFFFNLQNTRIQMNDEIDPASPAAGDIYVYAKQDSGFAKLFYKQSDGTVVGPLGAGGGAQTPWISNIDADGFDLEDLSNITFRDTTGAPSSTLNRIWSTSFGLHLGSAAATEEITFALGGTVQLQLDEDGELIWPVDGHKIIPQSTALQILSANESDSVEIWNGTGRTNATIDINDLATTFRTETTDTAAYFLEIIQNNNTPADFRTIANIDLMAENSSSADTTYARISASSNDITAATEDGLLQLGVVSGGTLVSGIDIAGSSSSGANDALIGFFGETPVVQQSVASDTLANLYTALRNLGLIV